MMNQSHQPQQATQMLSKPQLPIQGKHFESQDNSSNCTEQLTAVCTPVPLPSHAIDATVATKLDETLNEFLRSIGRAYLDTVTRPDE